MAVEGVDDVFDVSGDCVVDGVVWDVWDVSWTEVDPEAVEEIFDDDDN